MLVRLKLFSKVILPTLHLLEGLNIRQRDCVHERVALIHKIIFFELTVTKYLTHTYMYVYDKYFYIQLQCEWEQITWPSEGPTSFGLEIKLRVKRQTTNSQKTANCGSFFPLQSSTLIFYSQSWINSDDKYEMILSYLAPTFWLILIINITINAN